MRVSLIRLLSKATLVCWLLVVVAAQAMPQSDNSGTTTGSSLGSLGALGTGGYPGAGQGGAAMADFDTLMNLIQQTIDPDSWLIAGGTSTILPYPTGVFVDPSGHMKRVRETEDFSLKLMNDSDRPRHPWRTKSAIRTISLKQVDQALARAVASGLRPTAELLQLAGLSHIAYVQVDAANEDILIAGPAGDQALGFELQDVGVVAALINRNTSPLGCSIEPTTAGLLEAKQMLSQDGVTAKLARNPRMVTEQLQAKIGPHHVHVFGMSSNTGTAVALVDADEHMKKVGFGTVATRERVNSYFDYLENQSKVPEQSMIRWWFAYADEPIRANTAGTMFQLPEECVAVLSQQQWVTQQGRAPSGGHDASADAFAQDITEHLPGLRSTHPSYARLCAVFELGLALQLAVESTGQPNLQAWLPNLCALGSTTSEENVPPKTVEGLTTWHKLKSGTIVAVVSGGVKVDARSLASTDKWESSPFLAASLVPQQSEKPSSAHGSWWWD